MPAPETTTKLCLNRKPGEWPTPLTAVRSRCLDCCCGSAKEVALCTCTSCALWPWRYASRARARRIIAEELTLEQVEDEHWAERLKCHTSQSYYRREYGGETEVDGAERAKPCATGHPEK